MNRTAALALLFLWFTLTSAPGHAHSLSDSYLNLELDSETVHGYWRISLADLELAVGLDQNRDGRISWGEILQQRDPINRHLLEHLQLRRGAQSCALAVGQHQLADLNSGTFLHVPLTGDCEGPDTMEVTYNLLFGIDASHRGILTVNLDQNTILRVFSPDIRSHNVSAKSASAWTAWTTFLVEGIWHIWIGTDHILFLFALLVPIALRSRNFAPPAGLAAVSGRHHRLFVDILKMVTAFTVAHSITLLLASLELVVLPSRLVESVIALSVAISGFNILYPITAGRPWLIAFAFGLVHGFGFAGVLGDLSLPDRHFVGSLLSFNIGVEIGQLVIVMGLVPALLLLGYNAGLRRLTLLSSGVLTIVIGLWWFMQRAFNL
ncbi:MAG: HupE/UreJ family protein [Pseudohongiellaceae bacterium]